MKATWNGTEYVSEDGKATYDELGFENIPHPDFDEDDPVEYIGGPSNGLVLL